MKIDREKCIGCELCLPWCPGSAIRMDGKKAEIIWDECTECGVCKRVNICPKDAIYQQPLEWPRSVRAVYSDPLNVHKETGLAGRGTEEIKTNDVTGRFKRGELGIAIEIGRPNIGARLRDLQRYSRALAQNGIAFEPANPLTKLIDPVTGDLPAEIVDEKVISAIIEFAIPEEKLDDILAIIDGVTKEVGTVISLDIASRVNEDGTWPSVKHMERLGRYHRPNAKINVGLGKP